MLKRFFARACLGITLDIHFKYFSELGNNDASINYIIPCLNGIIDIKVGGYHSIILDENGIAMGLGLTSYLGTSKNKEKNGIVILKKKIIQIETGRYQTFFFDKNNDVWVGGYNKDCGLGHTRNKYEKLQKNNFLENIKILHSNLVYSIKRNSFLDVITEHYYYTEKEQSEIN